MGAISKLDAVNHILLMAGESLVNNLDAESGIDTEVALFILDQFITDFQIRGLSSNKFLKEYKLDTQGVIDLPGDTLTAELISYHTNSKGYTIQGLAREDEDGNIRLFNVTDKDNQWDADTTFKVEIVYSLLWEELDTPVQRAVQASAARQYQLVMQGDADADAYLGQIEAIYAAKSRSSDMDDKNSSLFSSLSYSGRRAISRQNYSSDPSRFRYWKSNNG